MYLINVSNLNNLYYKNKNQNNIKKMNIFFFKNNKKLNKKKIFFYDNKLFYNKIQIKKQNIKITKKKKFFFTYIYKKFYKLKNKSHCLKLAIIFFNFFLTHNLNMFIDKLSNHMCFLQKNQLTRLIRIFQLFNNKNMYLVFKSYKISGMYIKISGKFNGFGGAKKIKKHIILHKIKFNDKHVIIKRCVKNIRHKVGLTTIAAFASFIYV